MLALADCLPADLARMPSVRSLGTVTLPGLSGVADLGILSGVGEILKGLAAGAATVPSIAATFGQNKQVNEAQKLQEEAIQAQTVASVEQSRESAASSASWAAAFKSAAPYVGGALVVAAFGYGVSRLLSGRRRR